MSNLGYGFEVELVDFLREELKKFFPEDTDINLLVYRVEGSGRSKNATKTGTQSVLEGDVVANLSETRQFPFKFLIEAKHHKSHTIEKSVSVKKEWVDQALHEANESGSLPIVAIKFKGVKPNGKELQKFNWADGHFGNSVHYIIPQHTFIEILQAFHDEKAKRNVPNLSEVTTMELIDELKNRLSR